MMPCSLATVLSTALILTVLAAASAAAVWLGLSPWWRPWLGSWHVAADLAALVLAYGLLSGLAVRLLLACLPLPPGTYGPGDAAYGRWQRLLVITMFGQWCLRPLALPLFCPAIARLYGARLGRGVLIGHLTDDPWTLVAGDGAVVGVDAVISGNSQSGGRLTIGRVTLGEGAVVGAKAMVTPGCTVGAGAQIQVGAVLVPGTAVGAGESWRGNPARPWRPLAPQAGAAQPVEAA